MTTLKHAFPSVFALAPSSPYWNAYFSWKQADVTLLQLLWDEQVQRIRFLPDFWKWTDAIIADLRAARERVESEAESLAIDSARFITSVPPLDICRGLGRMGDCYNWIWTAISSTHDADKRLNENIVSFPLMTDEPTALSARYFWDASAFIAACFYTAYKLGGLDEITGNIAKISWNILEINKKSRSNAVIFDAMSQMVVWAAHRDFPDGAGWAESLQTFGQLSREPRLKYIAELTFITPAVKYIGGNPQEKAKKILEDYSFIMMQHERLQVYCVAIDGLEAWHKLKAEVIGEIVGLRQEYAANLQKGESELEMLEQRVSIIHPLIYALAKWGEVEEIFEVLSAWYRRLGTEQNDSNILLVVPVYEGGAAYLWPGGKLLPETISQTSYIDVQQAASRALGSYFRGPDGDHNPNRYRNFRFDVVNSRYGSSLEEAMKKHYNFDTLSQRLPEGWQPRSIVVFPSGAEPFQALCGKNTGIEAPLEISFERANPPRAVRKVGIWVGGLLHEQFELDAISHVASRKNWTTEVFRFDNPTAQNFKEFYQDQSLDILWVISHGVQDPYDAELTGLHLPDGQLINSDLIRSWSKPSTTRRFLVLNSCSGATAQGRGGLARIGLAQSLVSASQLVVGHLWPVDWTTGLAFGATLAGCLEDLPAEQAAKQAISLMRKPSKLMCFLESKFSERMELLERLRRSSEDLESITSWGCPVLLT